MEDLFGRNINYLRISVTDRCNLRCQYCMPEEGICKADHFDIVSIEEIEEMAKTFAKLGVNKIRLTGGEPLVRKGIITLVEKIAKIDGINQVTMTTNGIYLKKYAKDLKEAGLDRVNISIDTFDEDKYSSITRGGKLKDVLEGIEEAKRVGLKPIKLNVVLIGGFNDNEIEKFVYLTKDEEIDVRFIELMPIGETADWAVHKFVSNEIVLDRVKELESVETDDLSSPATYYKLPDGKGRVGLINPISCKFCKYCNRVRITSQGKLKLCLHSDEEIDLKGPLERGEDLETAIKEAIKHKPEEHHLEEGKHILKSMVQIGG